jgi:diguanylate cyclase (GGDEF)-like protein
MTKKLYLMLIDSGIVVKRLPLDQGTYIIGRSDDADFVISSKDVSRHHASIAYDGKSCVINDLKSTNGTFVNGKRIVKETLQVGDEVMMADYVIVLDDGSGKFTYAEATEIGRRGEETAIIEDKFSTLRQKLKDQDLQEEFKHIERVIKKSRKRLSTLANEDKLTGLYNRQYFDKISKKEFSEARRNNLHLSILFIDIDHFKRINDTYGHKVGDDALKVIAHLIRISCRKSDIVARYGGEEIVVILPETAAPDALKVGKDINKIIARQTKHILNIKITVSIGVATFPDDGTTLKAIMGLADKALYQAKRGGRNMVLQYDEKRS